MCVCVCEQARRAVNLTPSPPLPSSRFSLWTERANSTHADIHLYPVLHPLINRGVYCYQNRQLVHIGSDPYETVY